MIFDSPALTLIAILLVCFVVILVAKRLNGIVYYDHPRRELWDEPGPKPKKTWWWKRKVRHG